MSAPADFIPVAEESALIVEIGAWTLMQACHESAAAYGARRGRAGRSTSTCPAASSRSPTCPALVADCLRSSGLPGGAGCGSSSRRRVLLGAPKTARRNLDGRCASSASGSRSTTSAPATPRCATCRWRRSRSTARSSARSGTSAGDTAIVSAIISLARALGIDAIAEGVENEAQAALLRELGCPLPRAICSAPPARG